MFAGSWRRGCSSQGWLQAGATAAGVSACTRAASAEARRRLVTVSLGGLALPAGGGVVTACLPKIRCAMRKRLWFGPAADQALCPHVSAWEADARGIGSHGVAAGAGCASAVLGLALPG